MHSLSRTSLLLGVVSVIAAGSMRARAQAPDTGHAASEQEVDLAVSYLAARSNITPGQFFWQQGGSVELSAPFYHHFGVAMSITGTEAQNIAGTGVDLDMVTTTFGPRYTWSRPSGKVAVFGQGLIGIANAWNSFFPGVAGATTDANSFALQVGGGIDLRLSHHWAVRPIQADWVRTHFPNATTTVQNNLRLGGGLVFRIPQSNPR